MVSEVLRLDICSPLVNAHLCSHWAGSNSKRPCDYGGVCRRTPPRPRERRAVCSHVAKGKRTLPRERGGATVSVAVRAVDSCSCSGRGGYLSKRSSFQLVS